MVTPCAVIGGDKPEQDRSNVLEIGKKWNQNIFLLSFDIEVESETLLY